MHTFLILAALVGCGSTETAPEAPAPQPAEATPPKPVDTPPQPEALPPPVPAAGGPRIVIPGNYLPEQLQIDEGEAVRVLCRDRLVDGRINLIPVGEGRVTPNVPQCPKFQVLFRGLDDRMGPGTIKQGVGRGPFGAAKPRDWSMGHLNGIFGTSEKGKGYDIWIQTDGVGKQVLVAEHEGPGTAGLNWIGDLDDDGVPDFVINTPPDTETAHMRLFLSAKSADRQPEQVAEFPFALW